MLIFTDESEQKIITSRPVIFDEHSFPFQRSSLLHPNHSIFTDESHHPLTWLSSPTGTIPTSPTHPTTPPTPSRLLKPPIQLTYSRRPKQPGHSDTT